MSVLVRFAPKALTVHQYDEAIKKLGDDVPDGREYHVCFGSDDNLRVSEIWETPAHFQAYGERLMPILAEIGIEPGEPEIINVYRVVEPATVGSGASA